jgi:hypothetical protein
MVRPTLGCVDVIMDIMLWSVEWCTSLKSLAIPAYAQFQSRCETRETRPKLYAIHLPKNIFFNISETNTAKLNTRWRYIQSSLNMQAQKRRLEH